MSTFSGLGTALSSLVAQRVALDVAANNVANVNTVGYTRQRAVLSSLPASTVPSMFSTSDGVGLGTTASGIQRLGDVFLDNRVRTAAAGAGRLDVVADAYTRLEKSIGEPAKTALGAQLSDLWAGWSDVARSSDQDAARAVLLERAVAVTDRLHAMYSAAGTQWEQARTEASALVERTNVAAGQVADLNERILAIENAGGQAHELADQRDMLVTELADLVGATARVRDDGQVDVFVGGNALVRGDKLSTIELRGATSFSAATGGQAVSVVWSARPDQPVGLADGRVAGLLTVLAPPAGGGGGVLTEAAAGYDELARTIAGQVNALHREGHTRDGATDIDFFRFEPGVPAALGLRVAVTDVAQIAAGGDGLGAYDGSVAAAIAKIGAGADGPDAQWRRTVTDIGVRTASATSRAQVAAVALSTAEQQQLANASVDVDEETVNMLAYQRAYEGAARVLTAIDEMLDTLINRTGVVGR
ncbi:flagellar hook-associated protein FlgK [Cellulomonas sp. JZ18]|uniref:flagellar hook-associated protein FlgK n=1 Tax=Cellulomonas sp. JZ18 TaxID=2654191 RepID=UPI0012D43997|nr:flagellar hook-associated protein FlgK [Cellulomonas sp. JZ18]QGQ20318.1 flagellar hook-associated protein FlgK [Cellulomonas sp. JZ18]